jgi:hypothetical protein
VTVYAPNGSLGIALAYAYRDQDSLTELLQQAISGSGSHSGVANWIGIARNLGTADPPLVIKIDGSGGATS